MSVRGLVLVLMALSAGGCGGYRQPSSYVHYPEYGYLPVIPNAAYGNTDILVRYVAFDWYQAAPGERAMYGDGLSMTPRASLPRTRDEAVAIVTRNFRFHDRMMEPQRTRDLLMAPVAVPMVMLYWAPGIHLVVKDIGSSTPPVSSPQPRPVPVHIPPPPESAGTPAPPPMRKVEGSVLLEVLDAAGKPVSGANVVVLSSPTEMYGYADDAGRRTFPRQAPYDFRVSDALALALAADVGAQDAPKGVHTDDLGRSHHEILIISSSPGAHALFLISKEGYAPGVVRAEPGGAHASRYRVTLSPTPARAGNGARLNPWKVARELAAQIDYYREKQLLHPRRKIERPPPLDWSTFERYVLAGSKLAPEYPVVQSARFYYEVESRRPEEARKFARFIPDDVYVRVVHKANWSMDMRVN